MIGCGLKVILLGERILSPVVLLVFLLVVLFGTSLMMFLTKKKWGYTEKREQELEKEAGSFLLKDASGKRRKNR